MLQQLLTISRNTFQESIRQPIFTVLIFIASLAQVLNVTLAAYTFEDDNKLLIDLGLSTLFVIGLLLAAFTATGVVSAEIENRTVLTVVSKPVPRPLFILGKYLGVAFAIGLAYWTITMVFLLGVRHGVMTTASDHFDAPVIAFGFGAAMLALIIAAGANYLYRWPFCSVFVSLMGGLLTLAWLLVLVTGKNWQFQPPTVNWDSQLMIGLVMVFEAVLILTAVAVAVSTRLGQVMTLLICAGVFGLGLITNYLDDVVTRRFQDLLDPSLLMAAAYGIAKLMARITPNMQFLWPADALTQEHEIPLHHLGYVSAYAGFYIAALLGLAVSLFQTRDVG